MEFGGKQLNYKTTKKFGQNYEAHPCFLLKTQTLLGEVSHLDQRQHNSLSPTPLKDKINLRSFKKFDAKDLFLKLN